MASIWNKRTACQIAGAASSKSCGTAPRSKANRYICRLLLSSTVSPMKEENMNKFDRIVWRINGLLILCVGVVGGLVLLYASYEIFQNKTRDRNVGDIVNVNKETQKKEHLFLGSFSRIEGRDLFLCPLLAEQEYDQSYYSKSATSVRNYLFFDQADTTGRWLLESNNWLIHRRHQIYENYGDEKKEITQAFFYEIVKTDTNGDGILNSDDSKAIYISSFDGTDIHIVLGETTDILGINQIDEKKSIIFFSKDQTSRAVVVDNFTGKILKNTALPLKG